MAGDDGAGRRGPIGDDAVVAVLRPFVRATRPVLDGLRESDPFGLRTRVVAQDGDRDLRETESSERGTTIDTESSERGTTTDTESSETTMDTVLDALAAVHVPGTAAWAGMDTAERSRWWVRRVGRLTSLVAAVPGFGGFVTSRLPVSATLGAAAQGLVLCAIAGEHGVRDEDEQVALLGEVLFDRRLRPGTLTEADDAAADARAAELTGDLRDGGDSMLKRVASTMWRLGRALFALEGELSKRPHGRFYHRWLGNLPVVGAVGKYLGEWSGLQEAAAEGELRLRRS